MPLKPKHRRHSRSTSVSPPGRGLNHYTHVELDQIHARLFRNNISLSSPHKAAASHGLRVDKIDSAISLVSQSVQIIAGRFGERIAQSVQLTAGLPNERITELNLELNSLLQTLTLAKLANSANLRFVDLNSSLTETVNAEIHDCCIALDEFLDEIRKQPSLGFNVWGWWSRVSRGNGLDENKLADFRANWSDTRKLLRKFMLRLTKTLDSQHPAPVDTDNRQEHEHSALRRMSRGDPSRIAQQGMDPSPLELMTSPPRGLSNDPSHEGRNLISRVQDHTTHSEMFQGANSDINGGSFISVGHDMAEHNHTRMTRGVFNLIINGTADLHPVLYFNPQHGTTPGQSHDEIPIESPVASQSTAHSTSSHTSANP